MNPEEKFKTLYQVRTALEEIKKEPSSNKYSDEDKAYLAKIEDQAREFISKFQAAFLPYAEKLTEAAKLFAKSFKTFEVALGYQRKLALESWYLPTYDIDVEFIFKLTELIKKNEIEEVNRILISFYNKEFENLSNEIIDQFPKRVQPLRAAFDAHIRGDYFLSIPVYFAQIEGIFEELTSFRFFGTVRNKGIPNSKKYIDEYIETDIMKLILIPIEDFREANRKQSNLASGLNRHDVLHGTSNDYGNELNSLKVFSLLVFIVNVLGQSTPIGISPTPKK